MMPTAILVDGGFFLHRYRSMRGDASPHKAAKDLHRMCLDHLFQGQSKRRLYRIFFYDCPPLCKKAHNPLSGIAVVFSKTPTAIWRLAFHDELRKLRKVALRLGYLHERFGRWVIMPDVLKCLFTKKLRWDELTEEHVKYETTQKGAVIRDDLHEHIDGLRSVWKYDATRQPVANKTSQATDLPPNDTTNNTSEES